MEPGYPKLEFYRMPFEKGRKKTGGKKKGTPNKTTAEIREILTGIIQNEIPHVEKALLSLRQDNESAYIDKVQKLMEYVLPKKRDITSDDKAIIPAIVIKEDRDDE